LTYVDPNGLETATNDDYNGDNWDKQKNPINGHMSDNKFRYDTKNDSVDISNYNYYANFMQSKKIGQRDSRLNDSSMKNTGCYSLAGIGVAQTTK
jgi:hypothetical protein